MFSAADHAYMSQALQLAEKGLYSTSPNPRVGCLIVRDDRVIGRGWHEKTGCAHAETRALDSVTTLTGSTDVRSATVYLTLEPCSHYGHTPPCVDALIRAGVARVVMAMQDPDPRVAGKGAALLRQAGIAAETGLMEDQAGTLNAGFVSRMVRKRPWVRTKIAASLDGKTALNNGVSQWITGEAARRDGHHFRACSCAILTSIGTVLADNPALDVRHVVTDRQPLRVIVDSKLRISPAARVLRGEGEVIFTASSNEEKIRALQDKGARPVVLPDGHGRVDLVQMMQSLAELRINEVLVEAGSGLNGALAQAGLIDEWLIYLAPHLMGDVAQGMLQFPELADMSGRTRLDIRDVRFVGQDIRIIARPA